MSKSHRRVIGVATTAIALCAILSGWLLLAGTSPSQAQGDPPAAEPTAEEIALWEEWKKLNPDPFKPLPADPGAIAYDDLTTEDKASADGAALRSETNHGYEVHQAWSRYSQHASARARLKRAEYEAGLAGAADVGVE